MRDRDNVGRNVPLQPTRTSNRRVAVRSILLTHDIGHFHTHPNFVVVPSMASRSERILLQSYGVTIVFFHLGGNQPDWMDDLFKTDQTIDGNMHLRGCAYTRLGPIPTPY